MPSLLSVLPSAPLKLIFALTDYIEDPSNFSDEAWWIVSRNILTLLYAKPCNPSNATQATQPKQRSPNKWDVPRFVDALLGHFGTKERRIWATGFDILMGSSRMLWRRLLRAVVRLEWT